MTEPTSRASVRAITPLVVAALLLAAVAAGSGLADGAAASAAPARAAAGASSAVAPLRAWGYNHQGQLGDGSLQTAVLPVKVRLARGIKITAVRAGCSDSLALTSAGRVYAWGDNSYGQLGDGTTSPRTVPVRVRLPEGADVTAIRAGCTDNMALTASGRVYAWGGNSAGELGDGSYRDRHRPVPVRLPRAIRIKTISAGCGHNLAITSAGRLLAWGSDQYGQLGNGTTTSSDAPVSVRLPAGTHVRAISAGCDGSYAVTRAGRVLAWGLNSAGELGNGLLADAALPVIVRLPARLTATAVASGPGAVHAFAIVRRS